MVINETKQKSKCTQFLVDGVLTEDSKLIAEKFNRHFANIGSDLAKKIPNVSTGFKEFLKGNYAQSLFLKPVYPEEIREIILSRKEGAPGLTILLLLLWKVCWNIL